MRENLSKHGVIKISLHATYKEGKKMARNKLTDLNNHLFEALERLNDAESEEEVEKELRRSKAIADIGRTIISNAELVFEAERFATEYDLKGKEKPTLLRIESNEKIS